MSRVRLTITIVLSLFCWSSIEAQPKLSIETRTAFLSDVVRLTVELETLIDPVGSISFTLEAQPGLTIDDLVYVGREDRC